MVLLAQLRPGLVGGVVHHVDQAALRPALLQPRVKAAVHLHQLSEMFLALAPPAVLSPLPFAAPQPLRQHPAPQRLRIHLQPILAGQVLRCQCRTEALAHCPAVFLPHQMHYLPPKRRVVRAIGYPPCTTMPQSRRPFFPVALPQPLRLPVAHAQQSPCIHHPQLLALHTCQHFHPAQLPLAHLCPPQSDLLPEVLLRGHFYRGQKGTLPSRYNSVSPVVLRLRCIDRATNQPTHQHCTEHVPVATDKAHGR